MLKKTGPGGHPMHSSLRFALRFAALLPGLLVALPARAQTTCSPAGAQVSHDSDLAADCAASLCVERVCVDTLYRRATVCGHGFAGAPAVLVGGQSVTVLSNTPGPCGAGDEAMVIGLDDAIEGQHKLVVYNGSRKSEPFFIKVGDLAGPQGPVGPQGQAGPVGPRGNTGPQGIRGSSVATDPSANLSSCPSGSGHGFLLIDGTGLTISGSQFEVCDGATGAQGPPGSAGSSNLSLSTPLYTVHPSCTGPGAMTLNGTCAYTITATNTSFATDTGCPAAGATRYVTLNYTTTPTTCAARCTATTVPRTVCIAESAVCPAPCSGVHFSLVCLAGAPTCTANGTVDDINCNCDNTLLGYLVQ